MPSDACSMCALTQSSLICPHNSQTCFSPVLLDLITFALTFSRACHCVCTVFTHRWSSPVLPSRVHTGRYQARRSVRVHTLQCTTLRRNKTTLRLITNYTVKCIMLSLILTLTNCLGLQLTMFFIID